MQKLGRSQQAVFDYIKAHPGCTVMEVGEALYNKVSGIGTVMWTREKLVSHWARGIVTLLKKKGLVRSGMMHGENRLWVMGGT